jgi:hypothetical protein
VEPTAATAVVMAADRATACCGSAAAAALRGPSLTTVAVLSAAHGALDERRLVGTAASDLNTLAGVRGARWAPPCEHENEKSNICLSKTWRLGEWSLTSGWRSLTSSSLGARRTSWLQPKLPPRHPPVASTTRADASTARVASLMGRLATGAPAPAPGAVSSASSTALGEGGAGSHLSGGARPPSLPSSSSSSDDEYSEVAGEDSPCCTRSRNSSLLCSRRSRRRRR